MGWRTLKGETSYGADAHAQTAEAERVTTETSMLLSYFDRMIRSTLEDVENRYNQQMERTTLMEQEIIEKLQLEETNQRLRDEIRGKLPKLVGGH